MWTDHGVHDYCLGTWAPLRFALRACRAVSLTWDLNVGGFWVGPGGGG